MSEGALVAELAVALDEPGAYILLPAGFECLMGERAGRASGARPNFEEFARDMGEVFNFEDVQTYSQHLLDMNSG